MDFSLNEVQRGWQLKAREFARDEIRPLSLRRDQLEGGFAPWDWDIIRKGSQLGFRTLAVPEEWGGPAADFVTQGLVMAELASGDSAMSKAFSQNWKWSHLIAENCTRDQKERFLRPFLADDTYTMGAGSTEPNAGSDNRYPPEDDPRSGWRLRAERRGDDWILNGEKTFIANGSVGKLFFVSTRTNPDVPIRDGTTVFMVPLGTPGFRVGKIFNKAGWRFYQNAELVFEDARVPHANIVGEVHGGVKVRSGASAEFNDFELAANARRVRRGVRVRDAPCQERAARRQAPLRPPDRATQAQRDARPDRGLALICAAHRLGDGPSREIGQPGPGDELLFGRHPARDAPESRDTCLDSGHGRRHGAQARARRHHLVAPRGRHHAAVEGHPQDDPVTNSKAEGGRKSNIR
jgi:Acyl-CoA dehydrogenase, middle domain/Acyl-CoA dehydrogenase, N-terminal domain